MEIINKKIVDLIPYQKNSRTHSIEQIKQIENSIKQFGFTNPILINNKNIIIAGHGRLEAVKNLGLLEVPCILISHLSEKQIKALIIADNKIALNAGWDFKSLSDEIKNLKEENFDLDILGFPELELSNILFDNMFDDTENNEDKNDLHEPNNFIIQYNIIFDNVQQQDAWFQLIKNLKILYPDFETTGERLIEFIKSKNYGQS